MEPNYSGWASKPNIKCTDGRTIQPSFGKKQFAEPTKLPFVYQHNHSDAKQVLGYAILQHMEEGLWTDLYFNNSDTAKAALEAVDHGDLEKLSVWAKDLQETYGTDGLLTHDGVVQEVSLVLAGANSGASLVHGDGAQITSLDESDNLVMVGFELYKSSDLKQLAHADDKKDETPAPPVQDDKPTPPADKPEDNESVADVLKGFLSKGDEREIAALNDFIGDIAKEAATEALTNEPALAHTGIEGANNMGNAFDQGKSLGGGTATLPQLKHDDVTKTLAIAKGTPGNVKDFNENNAIGSLREFLRSGQGKELMHADGYGVDNYEILFPDAVALMNRPTFVDRRQEWVKAFLNGTSHSPFSRIKTMHADITADEARARGYIKGNRKIEEVFPVFKRTTGPDWIYKKQAMDRQDILDITTFDVIAWIKVEMRGKLDEELARAALFGDGREAFINLGQGLVPNPDKIKDPAGANDGLGIRSIVNDDDLYATKYYVPLAANATGQDWNALLDKTIEANEFYMGGGNKTAFISFRVATKLLTMRDDWGKRLYRNLSEVAGDMDVNTIVRVPTELFPEDCLAIVLDLRDYNFGTDKGGEVTLFDDFDIHFNKYYYLMETYLSGALTMVYSAQLFYRTDPAGDLVEDIPMPTVSENVITVPTATGVRYVRKNSDGTTTALVGGSTVTLNDSNTKQVEIEALPASDSFYFESNSDRKDTKVFRYRKPAE